MSETNVKADQYKSKSYWSKLLHLPKIGKLNFIIFPNTVQEHGLGIWEQIFQLTRAEHLSFITTDYRQHTED